MARKKEEGLKESILESARGLFAQFGPKKTTVDEIALAAGVGKGTVYYYFEDKEDIFLEVIREEMNELFQRINRAIGEYENPALKLQALFVERIQGLAELLNLRWLKFYSESIRWESLEREERRVSRKEQELVADILEEGKAKGLFAFEDAKKISRNLINMVSALDRTFSQDISLKEMKKKIEDVLGIIIEGLRTRELEPEGKTN